LVAALLNNKCLTYSLPASRSARHGNLTSCRFSLHTHFYEGKRAVCRFFLDFLVPLGQIKRI
jgi:hypothetical protein